MTDTERATDLWYSVKEHDYSKERTRGLLVEFLKLEAGIAKRLEPELREAINPPGVPRKR